jgi:hypothetical protein
MSDSPEQLLARQARFLYRNDRLTDEFESLREVERKQVVRSVALEEIRENSTLPLRDDVLDRMGWQEAMEFAESLRPVPAANEMEALREAGIPMREASRPAHEVVADLASAIPADHPDAETVKSLLTAGAALSADQRHEVAALANKHSALLAQNDNSDEVRESMRALREAGVPTTGGGYAPEPEPQAMTPAAAPLASGVPLKARD